MLGIMRDVKMIDIVFDFREFLVGKGLREIVIYLFICLVIGFVDINFINID